MQRDYWIERMNESVARAHEADSAEARLAHYELAGRYSLKAKEDAPMPRAREGRE